MEPLDRPLASRIKWGNVGRLSAIVGAVALLLFGSRIGAIVSEPELPEKAGLPAMPAQLKQRSPPGGGGFIGEVGGLQSARHTVETRHVALPSDGRHGKRRHRGKKTVSRKRKPQASNGLYQMNVVPAPPSSPSQAREFTPG